MEEKVTKIGILGPSGSGKSSFMAGLFSAFLQSSVRYPDGTVVSLSLTEEDGSEDPLTAFKGVKTIHDSDSFSIMTGAAGTRNIKQYDYSISINKPGRDCHKVYVRTLDYRGGLISNIKNNQDLSEITEVVSELIQAETLFIVCDSIQLWQYRNQDDARKRAVCADKINPIFLSLARQMENPATVILLLTKTDSSIIPDEYKSNNFAKLKMLAISTYESVFLSEPQYVAKGWAFKILPVTLVGEGNSVTRINNETHTYICEVKPGSNPKQKNMDIALLYAIKNTSSSRAVKTEMKIKSHEKIRSELKAGSIFDRKGRKKREEVNEEEIYRLNKIYRENQDISTILSEALGSSLKEFM